MDTPSQSEEEEPDYSKMTPAERKKAKNIARKKKKAQEKNDSNGSSTKSDEASKTTDDGKKKAKNHPVNEDPNGAELLALDPAAEAKKFAAILVRHAPKKISSWALQYDVSVRRGKMLMALQVSTDVVRFASLILASLQLIKLVHIWIYHRPYAK